MSTVLTGMIKGSPDLSTKLYKVTFGVEEQKKGESFKYFSNQRDAMEWIVHESPHELTMDFDQDVKEVTVPTTRKGLAEYLNEHHCYW